MSVVSLHGDVVFQPDTDLIIETMKGRQFDRLLILASFPDGSFEIAGNASIGEGLYLIERARLAWMEGDEP